MFIECTVQREKYVFFFLESWNRVRLKYAIKTSTGDLGIAKIGMSSYEAHVPI